MAGIASPAKVELSVPQSQAILKNLSRLAKPKHKDKKLNYSQTSITLSTNSSTVRTVHNWWNYYAGSEVTPDLEALLPLITKVQNCITKNQKILNEYSDRTSNMELIGRAVKGLEALKINQYNGQDKKQKQIDESIKVLNEINGVLEEKQRVWRESSASQYVQNRQVEEAKQKAQEDRFQKLEEENRNLLLSLAASRTTNLKEQPTQVLLALAKECITIVASRPSS